MEVKLPWLDIEILDFYKRVPVQDRMEKFLYVRTIEHMFPELRAVPYATRHSLEDWSQEVRSDPELRGFLHSALLEQRNEFDTLIDPSALRKFVTGCLADPSAVPLRARVVQRGKQALRRVSPPLYRRIKRHLMPRMAVPQMSPIPLLFRTAVAKLWFEHRRG